MISLGKRSFNAGERLEKSLPGTPCGKLRGREPVTKEVLGQGLTYKRMLRPNDLVSYTGYGSVYRILVLSRSYRRYLGEGGEQTAEVVLLAGGGGEHAAGILF